MSDVEKSVKLESSTFRCKKCESDNLWYIKSDTYDGAYDTYSYHCHACGYKWKVVDETD